MRPGNPALGIKRLRRKAPRRSGVASHRRRESTVRASPSARHRPDGKRLATLERIRVGIDMMPYFGRRRRVLVDVKLDDLDLAAERGGNSSSAGLIIRHGPHHSAQSPPLPARWLKHVLIERCIRHIYRPWQSSLFRQCEGESEQGAQPMNGVGSVKGASPGCDFSRFHRNCVLLTISSAARIHRRTASSMSFGSFGEDQCRPNRSFG